MFIDTTLKKFTISEQDKLIGRMEINEPLIASSLFFHPFIRESGIKTVTKIGDRDYIKLNEYIITSMKDYYNRLMSTSSVSEKNMMLVTYNHLYEMWTELYEYRKTGNLKEMDKTYDLFSYELYVLGYTD